MFRAEVAERARELPFPWDVRLAPAAWDASDAALQGEGKDAVPAATVPLRDGAGKLVVREPAFHRLDVVPAADLPGFPPVLPDEPR